MLFLAKYLLHLLLQISCCTCATLRNLIFNSDNSQEHSCSRLFSLFFDRFLMFVALWLWLFAILRAYKPWLYMYIFKLTFEASWGTVMGTMLLEWSKKSMHFVQNTLKGVGNTHLRPLVLAQSTSIQISRFYFISLCMMQMRLCSI